MISCEECQTITELVYYKGKLLCINCAKSAMWNDGTVLKEIKDHEC